MEKALLRCQRLCFCIPTSRWSSAKSISCVYRKRNFSYSNIAKVAASVESEKGLAKDPSWEAEVLRHEKLLSTLRDEGTVDEELPILERDKKVDSLPHVSSHGRKDFERETSLLNETAQLLLGKVNFEDHAVTGSNSINLDEDFIKDEVQEILQRLHYSHDVEKAYRLQIQKREEMPTVKYLTEQQLKEEMDKIKEQSNEKLKMLPVFVERAPCEHVLAEDSVLDGHEQSSISFVDISDDLKQRERFIVIREPNGVLRKANWKERDRLIQTYYPKPERKIIPPSFFTSTNLSNVFSMNLHENALDQCVVQFEPDSKEYIEVFQAVYEDINNKGLFDSLRSTRYFGGLIFYLAKTFQMDKIILDMLRSNRLDLASDCVKLLTLLHPQCKTKSAIQNSNSELSIIEEYAKLDSKSSEELLSALPVSKS